jgi:hypothetical protein
LTCLDVVDKCVESPANPFDVVQNGQIYSIYKYRLIISVLTAVTSSVTLSLVYYFIVLRADVAPESEPNFLFSAENIKLLSTALILTATPQMFPAPFACNYETCRSDATTDLA